MLTVEKFLIVLRGPSGSGKTSLAKAIQEKVGKGVAHLKADYFYWKVCPQDDNKHIDNNPIVYENILDLAENYLKHGYSIIIEGFLNQIDNFKVQDKLKALAELNGTKYRRYYLDVDLETAKKRHESSDFSVPIEEVEGWRPDRPMNRSELDIVINTPTKTTEEIAKLIMDGLI